MNNKNFSLLDILAIVFKRKKVILLNFFGICLVAIGISLLFPKLYKSSVVFIPPGQSSSGILSMLGNNFSEDILADSKFSKRQYIALLNSRELQEQLIDNFNLIDVYKLRKMPNSLDLALKTLQKKISIKETEEGGLGITDIVSVDITVIDKDPKRASNMANYLFDLLQKKVLNMNQRKYLLQNAFITQQMDLNISKLTSARNALKNFQVTNQAYDVSTQARMTIRSLGQLEADKMSLEIQKAYLQKSFSPEYSEISELNQKLTICNQKISELEKRTTSSLTPGLQNSLNLSDEYVDHLKEVETYIQLNYVLRQQLEISKLKQQKSYTEIDVIDHARPAQYKFKPKRAIIVLVIVSLYMISMLFWIIFYDYYLYVHKNHPEKIENILQAFRK